MSTENSGAQPPRSAPGTTCPTCGAPAQRGQLVCLECGGRIALTYRRPPSWKIPVAITAVVAALVVAGAALAYSALDDNAKQETAATPAQPKPTPATGTKTGTETTATIETTTTSPAKKPAKKKAAPKSPPPAPAGDAIVRRGGLYTWPKTLSDFTVVVLSAQDRASATTFARSAASGSSDKIGVIRSDDFKTLPKGFYVVFAGQYPSRAKADKAAARLGKRFQGAFAQAVTR